MINVGYKSAYQQGYRDAMRDFREKSKTDVLYKIRAEIQSSFENSTEPTNNIDAMHRNIGREECLEIIDKYTGGMSDEVREHYERLAEHYENRNS